MTNRHGLQAILLATATTLLLAACGGGAAADDTASDETDDDAKRVAYNECLRKAGVDVHEQTRNGETRVDVRVPSGMSKARMATLERGCARTTGGGRRGGTPPSKAEQARFLDQALKFARCMRAQGIEMSDPVADAGGIRMGGPKLDPDSPAFRRALTQCESLNPKKFAGGKAK